MLRSVLLVVLGLLAAAPHRAFATAAPTAAPTTWPPSAPLPDTEGSQYVIREHFSDAACTQLEEHIFPYFGECVWTSGIGPGTHSYRWLDVNDDGVMQCVYQRPTSLDEDATTCEDRRLISCGRVPLGDCFQQLSSDQLWQKWRRLDVSFPTTDGRPTSFTKQTWPRDTDWSDSERFDACQNSGKLPSQYEWPSPFAFNYRAYVEVTDTSARAPENAQCQFNLMGIHPHRIVSPHAGFVTDCQRDSALSSVDCTDTTCLTIELNGTCTDPPYYMPSEWYVRYDPIYPNPPASKSSNDAGLVVVSALLLLLSFFLQ